MSGAKSLDEELMSTDRMRKEYERYEQMLVYEQKGRQQGFVCLAGIDEAGRGPLAGPVAAAACILNPAMPIYGLNDSKKLTPASRKRLYQQITRHATAWSVVMVGPDVIDRINILQATCQAMRQAVQNLRICPDLLLIDAVRLDDVEQEVWPIVRGDALSVSIAAASILAKVSRDQLMDEYDLLYPGYGFAQHKGYGTPMHYDALIRLGPCPIHRQTFLRTLSEHIAARNLDDDEAL